MTFKTQTLFSALSTAMELLAVQLTRDDYIQTPHYEDVNSYDKIVKAYRKHGRLLVWNGASEYTVYDSPASNVAFRAVHDWIHIHFMLKFTPEDEIKVFKLQRELVANLVKENPEAFTQYITYDQSLAQLVAGIISVMQADLNGLVAYEQRWGFYPLNQKAFVEQYLTDPAGALDTRYQPWEA